MDINHITVKHYIYIHIYIYIPRTFWNHPPDVVFKPLADCCEVKHHHDWLITLSEESLPCQRLKWPPGVRKRYARKGGYDLVYSIVVHSGTMNYIRHYISLSLSIYSLYTHIHVLNYIYMYNIYICI